MTAIRSRARSGKGAGGVDPRRGTASRPVVAHDERRRLIEACAFFRAACYRAVEPGTYRAQDLEHAAAEIDAVLNQGARRREKV